MEPLDLDISVRLLQNSGFNVLGADSNFLYLEDPFCIARSFQTFAEYAWVIITCITAVLLFGWGISLIRGAKNDLFTNLRNLTLIFGILSAAGPIINTIYGDNLFRCDSITIEISEIQTMVNLRKENLSKHGENETYEEFNIYDSGALYETPYSDAPLYRAGDVNNSAPQLTITTNKNNAAISARENKHKNSVRYTRPDGTQYDKIGGSSSGSRSWLNNNPGNIRFVGQRDAIGSAGGFAVYASEEAGMQALINLLKTKNYQNKTIRGAMKRYAPASDGNNPQSYANKVARYVGVSVDTPMSKLTDAQLRKMAERIKQQEGYRPGKIQEVQ